MPNIERNIHNTVIMQARRNILPWLVGNIILFIPSIGLLLAGGFIMGGIGILIFGFGVIHHIKLFITPRKLLEITDEDFIVYDDFGDNVFYSWEDVKSVSFYTDSDGDKYIRVTMNDYEYYDDEDDYDDEDFDDDEDDDSNDNEDYNNKEDDYDRSFNIDLGTNEELIAEAIDIMQTAWKGYTKKSRF